MRQTMNVNSVRLYCEITGTGQAVVFIHGFTLDTRMWDDQFLPMETAAEVTQAIANFLLGL